MNHNGISEKKHPTLEPVIKKETHVKQQAAKMAMIIRLDEAIDLVNGFTGKWELMKERLSNPPDPTAIVDLPDTGQYVAFAITLSEMHKILIGATYVACIFGLNPKQEDDDSDDTISVIFVGLDGNQKPIQAIGIEKWPGIFTENPYTGKPLTRTQSAGKVNSQLILQHMPDYINVRKKVSAYANVWDDLVRLTKGNTPGNVMLFDDHPLAYVVPADDIYTFATNEGVENVEAIIGFFGYENNSIKPMCICVDDNGPVGKVFSFGSAAYTVGTANDMISQLLTF